MAKSDRLSTQADQIIPTKGSEQYYNAVGALLPEVENFYRYYQVPGLGHCFGGSSGTPTGLFEQLRAWVENGTAPVSTTVQVTDLGEVVQDRILCPYPQKAQYNASCGDVSSIDCWFCIVELSVQSSPDAFSEL